MSAYDELLEFLEPDERVEGIVFGPWGWGSAPPAGHPWELEYDEPRRGYVPFELRGRVLSLETAEPYMREWSFRGGYGAPTTYAVWVWTDRRVIFVTQYDGATWLSSVPRHPTEGMPTMPGG